MFLYRKRKVRVQFKNGNVDEFWVWKLKTRFSGDRLTHMEWCLCDGGAILFVSLDDIEFIRVVESKFVFRFNDPQKK